MHSVQQSPTVLAAIISAQCGSTFIRGPLVPRPVQMLPGPCKTMMPVPGGVTLAGRLADVSGFELSDMTLACLSPPLIVPGVE